MAFSEKRSESRSTRSMQKYQYFEWGSTLNLDGFKIIIFQYIICEPFRSWKEGLVKLDVNLWEIWRKFKCRRSASGPPLFEVKRWKTTPSYHLKQLFCNPKLWFLPFTFILEKYCKSGNFRITLIFALFTHFWASAKLKTRESVYFVCRSM